MSHMPEKEINKNKKVSISSGLSEKAYMGIRRMLFNNEITPGHRITYSDLVKRLGMSSTPIIQALKWLEIQGLVRHKPNRGYYTEPISQKEIEEIFEFREIIEISLLPKVIAKLNKKTTQQLRVALEANLSANKENSLSERILKDVDFHLKLASISQSHIQIHTLRHLFDLLYLKYKGNILFFKTRDTELVDSEHQSIFDSVVSKNLLEARKVLKKHITNVRQHVIAGLNEIIEEEQDGNFFQIHWR
jgi:DNA-binding GntR family transcriptional regulator